MRAIRFRAWEDGEMCYVPTLFKDVETTNVSARDGYGNEYPLMQFTGMTDKKGVDIYEGDLIESDNNCLFDAGRKIDSVKFDNGQFKNGSGSPLYLIVKSFRAEVIGNIHANPELLEQS